MAISTSAPMSFYLFIYYNIIVLLLLLLHVSVNVNLVILVLSMEIIRKVNDLWGYDFKKMASLEEKRGTNLLLHVISIQTVEAKLN